MSGASTQIKGLNLGMSGIDWLSWNTSTPLLHKSEQLDKFMLPGIEFREQRRAVSHNIIFLHYRAAPATIV
jgi:hypothetical protein